MSRLSKRLSILGPTVIMLWLLLMSATFAQRPGLDQIDLIPTARTAAQAPARHADRGPVLVDNEAWALLRPLIDHAAKTEADFLRDVVDNRSKARTADVYRPHIERIAAIHRSIYLIRETGLGKPAGSAGRRNARTMAELLSKDESAEKALHIIATLADLGSIILYTGGSEFADEIAKLRQELSITPTGYDVRDRELLVAAMLKFINSHFARFRPAAGLR